MKRSFDSPEEFYKNAMISINQVVDAKLKLLGVETTEMGDLIESGDLARYNSDPVDGIILEMYEYKGIRLVEIEWTSNGVKQRDINPDERDFDRTI